MSTTRVSTETTGNSQIRLEAASSWQEDLARDGFAVVRGAVPKERAENYTERLHEWLEGL